MITATITTIIGIILTLLLYCYAINYMVSVELVCPPLHQALEMIK